MSTTPDPAGSAVRPSADTTATTPVPPPPIDPRGPRTNQALLAVGLVVAFVLNVPWLVAALFVVLAAGAVFGPKWGLFLQLWAKVLRPRFGPPAETEDPRPPRFAAVVGTVFLAASLVAFAAGVPAVGWGLALVVAALAALAAITGICVGCEIYVRLARVGVIRTKAPVA